MTKFAIIAANRVKPEPLKGKNAFPLSGNYQKALFKEEDIRSAVEWLLEEVNAFEKSKKVKMTYTDLRTLINHAFEDVMK